MPLVSAVIPTRNRPALVCRAVRSALGQSHSNVEVIVVIDGPDPETVGALAAIPDQRLKIIALPQNVGGSEARNIGVRAAAGGWIAFLDDDDEWKPTKIADQLAAAQRSAPRANFVACRWVNRTPETCTVLPEAFPSDQEDWSEYIYCSGQSLPTSTYLVSREVMLAIPFTKGLPYNQDIDWFLRAGKSGRLVFVWVDDPLTVYYADDTLVRTSQRHRWEVPYGWALASRRGQLLSPKAFSYCILAACVPRARRSGRAIRDEAFLLRQAISQGHIDIRFIAKFVLYSTCGVSSKARLRRAVTRFRNKTLNRIRSAV
jgi:glycosyltransferase involved in cell wall biosynthesis